MRSPLGTPVPLQLFKPGRWRTSSADPSQPFVNWIAARGILEPITALLCEVPERAYLEIISGECRWLGAQRAGLKDIPAYVIRVPDELVRALVIIQSIERGQVLNEEASLCALREEFGVSTDQLQSIVNDLRVQLTG